MSARVEIPTDLTGPSVEADFIRGRYWANGSGVADFSGLPGLTVARASAAWMETQAGGLVEYPANTPRIRAGLGLRCEGQRTNVLRRSAFTGGVAGSPGVLPSGQALAIPAGLTQTLSFGTENGWPWFDLRLAGTVTTAGAVFYSTDGINLIAAAVGQTWSSSYYARLQAGVLPAGLTWTNRIRIANSAGGYLQASDTPSVLTATRSRFEQFFTITHADAAFVGQQIMSSSIPVGTVVDFTTRFYAPQLEQGRFASSPILTTGASLIRAADVIYLTLPAAGEDRSLIALGQLESVDDTTSRTLAGLSSGSLQDSLRVGRSSTASAFVLVSHNGVNVVNRTAADKGGARRIGLGLARSGGVWRGAIDGVAVAETPAATPDGLTRLDLGSVVGGASWDGWVDRIKVWRRGLTQTELDTETGAT